MTDGRFGLFRADLAPRPSGPGAHVHRTFSESFYVLEGSVRIFDGGRWVEAQVGDFVHVGEGGIHDFGNSRDEPAALLVLFAPAVARERYLLELAEIRAGGRTITSRGRAVAELTPVRPVRRRPISRAELTSRLGRAQADSGLRDDLAVLAGDTTDDLGSIG